MNPVEEEIAVDIYNRSHETRLFYLNRICRHTRAIKAY